MHAVEIYAARPFECEDYTFHEYFRLHRVESPSKPLKDRSRFQPVGENDGEDLLGNLVYKLVKRPRLLTFTEYSPGSNLQAWAYQHLLRTCSFRHESELQVRPLVGGAPEEKDYFGALIAKRIVTDMDDVHLLVDKYCTEHLVNKVHRDAMCAKIEAMYACDAETGEFLLDRRARQEEMASPDDSMRDGLFSLEFEGGPPPRPEQRSAVNAVLSSARRLTGGVHVITGGPGAGKTHIVRYITHALRSEGLGVALTATTGKAAKLLSNSTAYTLHKAFRIPAKGIAVPIDTWDPRYNYARDASVIIIDECSMLSSANLRVLHSQLMCIKGTDYLDRTTLVFVGDPKQLPPVCKHGEASMDAAGICRYCPLPRSPLLRQWKDSGRLRVHRIPGNQRLDPASSPLLSSFLEKIRNETPTRDDIDKCLGHLKRTEDQVRQELQQEAFRPGIDVAVCTYRKDAQTMNDYILRSLFQASDIEELRSYSSADACNGSASERSRQPGIPQSARDWCNDPDFHELRSATIGSHVMFTANSDDIRGYANGDSGTVTGFRRRNGQITAVLVKEDRTGVVYPLTRSLTQSKYIMGKQYVRRTFPLSPAYAITGHKCQGQTFTGRCFAFLAKGFVSGLAYVMLSRSTREDNLRIIAPEEGLQVQDFSPMPDLWDELEALV